MTQVTRDLIELAERVEKAEGADESLHAEIALAAGWQHRSGKSWNMILPWERPNYTGSIDAAMSLVPERHTVQLSDWDAEVLREKGPWQAIVLPMGARGSMTDFTFSNRCDHAATLPLAIVAAALRARSAATL